MSVSAEFKGKIPPDQFASLVYDVAKRYYNAMVCPENNAYGYTTLVKLKELGYKNIYFSSEKEKELENLVKNQDNSVRLRFKDKDDFWIDD